MLQPTRLISTPFAQEGDKTEIQDVTGEFDNSATYRLGFPPLTMQSIRLGGKPPKGTDFNGIFFDITENISFLCKGGRYQYNAGLSTLIGGYPEGSNLLLDDNVTEVVSTVAGNQNNPNTDMTGWILKPIMANASDVYDSSGENQQEINDKLMLFKNSIVSILDFGAKGDDDQTLYATNYQTDNVVQPTTITQQTADGLAINNAIKWLRTRGGGSLYIPPCEVGKSYRVYGYLERIDFPCMIYGGGSLSLIKSCDSSPTDKNGYGILHIEPANVSEITLMNLKIDGNAYVRTKPTSEWRSYNIHVLGKPQLRLINVDSINSPIDCFATRYKRPYELNENDTVFVKAVNCNFEDAYRNTISLVAGDNVDFVNCNIYGGGFVQGGTNPRFCLDIEPTTGVEQNHARNIKFTNCNFARALNAIIGGTWGQATFDTCTIDASYKHPSITQVGYPWAINLSSLGDWKLDNCVVKGNPVDRATICTHYNAYDSISDFGENGWLRIYNTVFEYCGFNANGRRLDIRNTTFKNSLRPFHVRKGTLVPNGDIFIRNMNLVNIFENTTGSGLSSSFSIANAHTGNIDIDGLNCIVDQPLLLKKFTASDFTRTLYSGFGGGVGLNNCAANGALVSVKNVFSSGYYQRINNAFSLSINNRDWENPNLPPANTDLVTSTITGTVSGSTVTGSGTQNNSISSRTLGGRTTATWKDCSMWGNFP